MFLTEAVTELSGGPALRPAAPSEQVSAIVMAAAGVEAPALKSPGNELLNSLISVSRDAAEKPDAVLREEPLPAAADAAADESVNA